LPKELLSGERFTYEDFEREVQQMRFRNTFLALLVGAGLTAPSFRTAWAQTPSQGAAQATPQKVPNVAAPQVYANLAQLMRGIMFPNSNVIFFAQDKNPADVKPSAEQSASTDPLSGSFGGWAAVENSSLALTEAANLLTIPGRVCSNGRPVPVKDAEWLKYVQGLREAGIAAYKAAQSKSNDNMLDAAGVVTEACSNCHNRYREKPGGVADRCK
jgi:hypothetical protein